MMKGYVHIKPGLKVNLTEKRGQVQRKLLKKIYLCRQRFGQRRFRRNLH